MTRFLSPAHGLAVVRIAFGAYFIVQAYGKTTSHWLTSSKPLIAFLRPQLSHAQPWYGHFLQTTVLPNAPLFARLVTIDEWVAGICLLLGLATQLGALTAMWLNLNYMLLKGLPNVGGSVDRLFFVSCLMFVLTSAGLVWGLDGLLQRLLPQAAPAQPRPTPVPATTDPAPAPYHLRRTAPSHGHRHATAAANGHYARRQG